LQWLLNNDEHTRVLESGERRIGSETGLGVLRFSGFELDSSVPELRRGGRRVHLQEMPLRLLEMLLECPDELVLREAFFARLWPDDHSGILDDNLNTAVRKLRLALNDSAHHPRLSRPCRNAVTVSSRPSYASKNKMP
jgi:DNA-binding response OmpR family regulator